MTPPRPNRRWPAVFAAALCLALAASCLSPQQQAEKNARDAERRAQREQQRDQQKQADNARKQQGGGGWFQSGPKLAVTVERASLTSARNEWIDLSVRVDALNAGRARNLSLRLSKLKRADGAGEIDAPQTRWYELADVPAEAASVEAVRHLGLAQPAAQLPRALLPLDGGKLRAAKGVSKQTRPLPVWADIYIPPELPGGDYRVNVELLDGKKVVGRAPVTLHVYDFVLPEERNLIVAGRIGWDDLRRLFPDRFEGLTKWLLSRTDDRTRPAVAVMDELVALCARNRVQAWFSDLQPVAKWPAGRPPALEWTDFDAIVTPWLTADGGAAPLAGWWAVPPVEYFDRYDLKSQLQYWQEAANHFEQAGWNRRTSALTRWTDASRLAALQRATRARLTVPLIAPPGQTSDPTRLQLLGPGLVHSGEAPPPPAAGDSPRWLESSRGAASPYTAATAEPSDVRLWGWLADHDRANLAVWTQPLPAGASPADPSPNAPWVYPGRWFGLDAPVETVWLKWLRRGVQDFEYLRLARLRGDDAGAAAIARLITRPVALPPGANPEDPAYAMMTGTRDPEDFDRARDLVARLVELRQPGQANPESDARALELETIRWTASKQRPTVLVRDAQWAWDPDARGRRVSLRLGVEIYNGSERAPKDSTLRWSALPPGFEARPQPSVVPELPAYRVTRAQLDARFDATNLRLTTWEPPSLTFVNGYDQTESQLRFSLPVASCDRRTAGVHIDGSLEDWSADEALYEGKLARALSRPGVIAQDLLPADTDSAAYTAWSPDALYVAFKLTGVSPDSLRAIRNFVEYRDGRAWGEDLCQLLLRPVFPDGSEGQTIHIVCKPGGQWLERRTPDGKWQPVEGAGIRYAATLDDSTWRGELAIPWRALVGDGGKLPSFLRLNFAQHRKQTAETSTWAGPVDTPRDDALTGLLILREEPGVPVR